MVEEIDINAKDDSGETTLHYVARCNNLTRVASLLFQGAEVDVRDSCNWTPLHFASKCCENDSHIETIEVFLKAEANINAKNDDRSTPLHLLVVDKEQVNAKTIELFSNYEADFNLQDDNGETPLVNAIRSASTGVVQLLLAHGSNANNVNESDGTTPLHVACFCKNIHVIKCLLKNGADISTPDAKGRTPLEKMFYLGRDNLEFRKNLKFLLEYSEINKIDASEKKFILLNGTRSKVWKTVLAHLAKLQALDVYVHPSLSKTILGCEKFSKYFDECVRELSLAKSARLRNSWITFFDLLVGSERKLRNYASNNEFITDFLKSDCSKKFPIYGALIKKNVIKGLKNRKSFDELLISFINLLPIFNPHYLILRDILDCVGKKIQFFKTFQVSKVVNIIKSKTMQTIAHDLKT